jgi:hypothetical protein
MIPEPGLPVWTYEERSGKKEGVFWGFHPFSGDIPGSANVGCPLHISLPFPRDHIPIFIIRISINWILLW